MLNQKSASRWKPELSVIQFVPVTMGCRSSQKVPCQLTSHITPGNRPLISFLPLGIGIGITFARFECSATYTESKNWGVWAVGMKDYKSSWRNWLHWFCILHSTSWSQWNLSKNSPLAVWTSTLPAWHGGSFLCKLVKVLQLLGPYLR